LSLRWVRTYGMSWRCNKSIGQCYENYFSPIFCYSVWKPWSVFANFQFLCEDAYYGVNYYKIITSKYLFNLLLCSFADIPITNRQNVDNINFPNLT
jgi:hypothetical protein